MRLTYKKLANIVSDKLTSVGIKHSKVKAYNPRFRSDDIEGGAACIIYTIHVGNNFCTVFSFQWISEIQDIINTGQYNINIFPKDRFTIRDSEIRFKKLK